MSKPNLKNLSANYVRQILHYNKRTGELRWKVDRPPRAKKGNIAGCQRPDGYIVIGIDGAMYLAHRLAWLIVTGEFPPEQVDHKCRQPRDMRWKNLRAATHAQNLFNQKTPKNNKLGIKGVSKRSDCNRFQAFISCKKQKFYLGLFKTEKEAAIAYQIAAKKLHGEFANF